MNNKTLKRVAALLLIGPLIANAEPITVSFSGDIIGYGFTSNLFTEDTSLSATPSSLWVGLGPSVGTSFSGTYTYDDDAVDGFTGGGFGGLLGSYNLSNFSGEVGGLVFNSGASGSIRINNNLNFEATAVSGVDRYSVVSGSCCASAVYDVGGSDAIIGMGLFLTGADVFTDDSLVFPTLGDFPSTQFRWGRSAGGGVQSLVGNLTSLTIGTVSVPEPGTLALFGVGLAAIGFTRRRKNA